MTKWRKVKWHVELGMAGMEIWELELVEWQRIKQEKVFKEGFEKTEKGGVMCVFWEAEGMEQSVIGGSRT